MSIISRLSNWIEKKKEDIVKSQYYKMHEKIFSISDTKGLLCMEEKIEEFYYRWVGYVDDVLLDELATALSKSLYTRNKYLASVERWRAVEREF